jgi:hypothetical protein
MIWYALRTVTEQNNNIVAQQLTFISAQALALRTCVYNGRQSRPHSDGKQFKQ